MIAGTISYTVRRSLDPGAVLCRSFPTARGDEPLQIRDADGCWLFHLAADVRQAAVAAARHGRVVRRRLASATFHHRDPDSHTVQLQLAVERLRNPRRKLHPCDGFDRHHATRSCLILTAQVQGPHEAPARETARRGIMGTASRTRTK